MNFENNYNMAEDSKTKDSKSDLQNHVNVRLGEKGAEILQKCSEITHLSRAQIVKGVFESYAMHWLHGWTQSLTKEVENYSQEMKQQEEDEK